MNSKKERNQCKQCILVGMIHEIITAINLQTTSTLSIEFNVTQTNCRTELTN